MDRRTAKTYNHGHHHDVCEPCYDLGYDDGLDAATAALRRTADPGGLTDREWLSNAWALLSKVERTMPHTSVEWAEVATAVSQINEHLALTPEAVSLLLATAPGWQDRDDIDGGHSDR